MTITFKPRESYLACDLDGTIKMYHTRPRRDITGRLPKGGQAIAKEYAKDIRLTPFDNPMKVVWNRSLTLPDKTEEEDFEDMMESLRQIGCPESKVGTLALEEFNRKYGYMQYANDKRGGKTQ